MAKAAPLLLSELICLRLHLLPLGASQASADCAGTCVGYKERLVI